MERRNIYIALIFIVSFASNAYTANRIFTFGKSASTIFISLNSLLMGYIKIYLLFMTYKAIFANNES